MTMLAVNGWQLFAHPLFLDQLDKLADDASFNGINLLRGDKLKITFNETGTSSIDIQASRRTLTSRCAT